MAWSALFGAWLAGTLGGVHCVAMCGGFVAAITGANGSARPLRWARTITWHQLAANLGRIMTYTTLGAIVGGAGSGLFMAAQWLPVQRALYVIANLTLMTIAITIVWRREPFSWLQRITTRAFTRLAPVIGPLARTRGVLSQVALGMVWGLVPCAMIYSVLPVALFSGDALQGAFVMLAFGLGTLPNLFVTGWIVARARKWLDRVSMRLLAGGVLAAFAGIGIWRALGDSALLAAGPFCLVH